VPRVVTLHAGERCCERDPLCPCRGAPSAPRDRDRMLGMRGARLVIRGSSSDPRPLVDQARRGGIAEIVLCLRADRIDDARARVIAAAGVDLVRAPIHAHVAPVHDRIAGEEGALVRALIGLRALAGAGVAIEIEHALLRSALTTPSAVLDLARRTVPGLRAIRFRFHDAPLPAAIAPPPIADIAAPLSAALRAARDAGIDATLDAAQGIPPCALALADPELLSLARVDRRARRPSAEAPCARCAIGPRCAGPGRAYLAAHGARDLVPFDRRPAALARSPRARRDAGSPAAGSSRIGFLVLRPTVHCNQDCVFCSANESSDRVWTDPGTMMRAIARAASRGVRRISFSGGEPTLSPHLESFVEVARRCGVTEVELVTNGVLLDREARVERLVRAGLTHAFVSLHAHDEALSRVLTRKAGDHDRTLRAIELLTRAGARTVINHVITTRNAPYLERFVEMVRSRFAGEVLISLALVTPQFKALEHPDLWPRLSEIAPVVRRALHHAIAIGQPVVVGSRQGIPPCFLGPFRGWSDALGVIAEAASEDTAQKQHGPACATCRYREVCPGLWRPYVALHGTGELVAVPGEPFSSEELDRIARYRRPPPWGMPQAFDGVHELLRDRALERGESDAAPAIAITTPRVHLPVLGRDRPLRVLLVGSGSRSLTLLAAAQALPSIAIEAIASPHAPEALLPEAASVPRYRSLAAALDAMRPEAIVIAAATPAHRELALLAIESGLPTLIEKPLARTLEEAEEIVSRAAGGGALVVPAHQDVLAPGLRDLLEAAGPLRWTRRCGPGARDLPRAWSRAALAQTLHHPLAAIVRAASGRDVSVDDVSFAGGGAPTRIRVRLRSGEWDAELSIEAASEDELHVSRGAWSFVRARGGARIVRDGAPERVDGDAIRAMLDRFARAARGEPVALPPLRDGLVAMRATAAVLDALERAGAPFDRKTAPRHVASPSLREASPSLREASPSLREASPSLRGPLSPLRDPLAPPRTSR
jgi:MoaA/NifB/PqqE/SkfB family radical SAM enzyme